MEAEVPKTPRRTRRRRFDPWRDRGPAVERLLAARGAGATFRQAAAAGGVHVATVCRWAARCPRLASALADAETSARRRRFAGTPARRPSVPWHPACPECGADAEVRAAWGHGFRFWRCGRWPYCPWASWRPRHPKDCPACGGPRYWSHSRKSVSCPLCGVRTKLT